MIYIFPLNGFTTTLAPITTANQWASQPFLFNPQDNQWVFLDLNNPKDRIKPESVGISQPESKSPFPDPRIWKNVDNGENAFFYDSSLQKYQFIDAVAGLKFDATNDFFQEDEEVLKNRQIDTKERYNEVLPFLKRNKCGRLWYFFDDITKQQVFMDIRDWSMVPVMSIGEFPLYAPIFISENSWLMNENTAGFDENMPMCFQDTTNECFFIDSESNQYYITSKYITKFPEIPLTFSKDTELRRIFKELVPSQLTFEIQETYLVSELSNELVEYFEVNPDSVNTIYHYSGAYQYFLSAENMKLFEQDIGSYSKESASPKYDNFAVDFAEYKPETYPESKKSADPNSSYQLLTHSLKSNHVMPNRHLVVFQLRERVASNFFKQMTNTLASFHDFTVLQSAKTETNTNNQVMLKPYVEMKMKRTANNKKQVQNTMIVKEHLYFNFTKFHVEQPTWITMLRHPLDIAHAYYGLCVNGTYKNDEFKGTTCNKKYRMRGGESFARNLGTCIKNTIDEMGPEEIDPPSNDCFHEKLYSASKYTCGQHPTCAFRMDSDPEKRKQFLEFTKLRLMNDYYAIGLYEEFELSMGLFERLQ